MKIRKYWPLLNFAFLQPHLVVAEMVRRLNAKSTLRGKLVNDVETTEDAKYYKAAGMFSTCRPLFTLYSLAGTSSSIRHFITS